MDNLGGFGVSNATLNRFFSLHYLLIGGVVVSSFNCFTRGGI